MEHRVILQVMGMDSTKYGGIEHFNVALSRALQSKRVKCIYIYEEEPLSNSFKNEIKEAGGELLILNSRNNPFRFCINLAKLLKKYHPEVVHAHFTKAKFYAIPIAYCMGVKKLFMTVHSSMITKSKIKTHTRIWYDWANRIAKTIAVSDDIARMCEFNWPNSAIRRIYLGVKEIKGDKLQSRSKLSIPENQLVLLCVANFTHIKGLDVLCKSVKKLKDRGKITNNICFYIVGQPDEDKQDLKKMIDSLAVQDFIMQTGISNDVPDYMLSADIYLQPSRSEGIGMALMEAASASLPLIGTNVGGIPEIVKDGYNGFLVPPNDPDSLAKAILNLLVNDEKRKFFGENSKTLYHEKFTISKGVEQTIEYYGI